MRRTTKADDVIDNANKDKASDSYDQYIAYEVVLPDKKGEKLMGKVDKRVRYDDVGTR